MPTYKYPRPALTVDAVVFGLDAGELKVLLIQRGAEPFAGCWALPGGFVHVGESPDAAVRRELAEETGLDRVFLEQLATFGEPDRDPREHTVTVAYFALVNLADHPPSAATDASGAGWFSAASPPDLAFDHGAILAKALDRLRGKLRYQPVGFELLPERFPLRDLQHLYESVLERELDKRNFRKKLLAMGVVRETEEVEDDVRHRAARLYTFDREAYEDLTRRGFNFEL